MKKYIITATQRDLYAYILTGQGMHTDAIDLKALKPIEPMTREDVADVARRMEASDPYDSFWDNFASAIEKHHGIEP